MNGIDPTACKFALTQIKDGFIFEEFSHSFLSAILGHSFLHAGGIKDRGIDGLENLFTKEGNERVIYQYSIEKDPEQKAARTLELLKANKIKFDQFTYVSNQEIHYKDKFLESLSETLNSSSKCNVLLHQRDEVVVE